MFRGFNYRIRTKSDKYKRERKTLAKKITDLAKAGEWGTARRLCEYGRELNHEEAFLSMYYEAIGQWEDAMNTGKQSFYPLVKTKGGDLSEEEFNALQENVKSQEKTICSIFLDAVNYHERDRIIRLAEAVSFFRDKRYPGIVPVERERNVLLCLKMIFEHTGEKLSIRAIAQFLALDSIWSGKKLESSPDGFSALRRKCRQLGIQLAESRKRSKK